MSAPVSYAPSSSFKEAATYLSNSSDLSKIPNDTKLELYGLYKFLMISPEPATPRPSIFSPTERAKHDAWKSAGLAWRGKESEAEARYLEIARSLGWCLGAAIEANPRRPLTEPTAEELLAGDSENIDHGSVGGGMGFTVSIMKKDEEGEEQSLHSIAISGDVRALQAFLNMHTDVDVNALDQYGFTALHLACDRGKLDVVRMLLQKGADINMKDSDGLSAVELASEAKHDDIVALLQSSA